MLFKQIGRIGIYNGAVETIPRDNQVQISKIDLKQTRLSEV